MTPLQPIHIIGAGIGGLTLARCFKNRRIQAIIYEKNASPAHHNYGISLQPWVYKLLIKVLDIDESTFARRVAVDGVRGGQGQAYAERSRSGDIKGLPAPLRAHRGRLEGLLMESLDVKWGHVLKDIDISSTGNGHSLTFQNNEEVESKLVVDTSGVHSPIRKSVMPDLQLNVLPYVVFRGTRRIDQKTFKKVYESHFGDGNILETMQGDVKLQISINDYKQDPDAVDISYIYSRPVRADDPLHRPGRDLSQSTDISEAFFEEVSKLGSLEVPFGDAFEEEKVRKGRTLHWLMRDVIVPREELVRLGGEGVMFIGDSAHALPILGGEGACFAIRDAVELAGVVDEGVKREKGVDVEGFYGKMFGEWEDGIKSGEQRLREMHFDGRSSL